MPPKSSRLEHDDVTFEYYHTKQNPAALSSNEKKIVYVSKNIYKIRTDADASFFSRERERERECQVRFVFVGFRLKN